MAARNTAEIRVVLRRQNELRSDYRRMSADIRRNNRDIQRTLRDTASTSASVSSEVQANNAETTRGFANLDRTATKALKGLVVGLLAVGTAKKAIDFSKEFAKFEQGAKAMETQFGVSSKEVIKRLDAVAKGTISSADLVQSANRAMALNVTSDLDKMSKLLEVARVRSHAMGTDTTQAFEDIVTGIGRASPLILDNLGIITKGWDEEAKAAGKAFDSQFVLNKVLDDGEKILERTGDVALTNAEEFQRMSAKAADLRLIMGEKLTPVLIEAAKHFAELFGDTTDPENFAKIMERIADTLAVIFGFTFDTVNTLKLIFKGATLALLEYVQFALRSAAKVVDFYSNIYAKLPRWLRPDKLLKATRGAAENMRTAAAGMKIEANDLKGEIVDIAKNINKMNDAIKNFGKERIKATGGGGDGTKLKKPPKTPSIVDQEKIKKELLDRVRLQYEIQELTLQAQEDGYEKEFELLQLKHAKELDIILNAKLEEGAYLQALTERQLKEQDDLKQKFADADDKRMKEEAKKLQFYNQQKLNSQMAFASAFGRLVKAVAGDSVAAFLAQQSVALSQIVVSTMVGRMKALQAGPIGIPVANWITAQGIVSGLTVAAETIRGFGDGGVVGKNGVKPSDTVPALLTPGEMVLNEQQQRSLLNGGAGTQTIENVNINVYGGGDPMEVAMTVEEKLMEIKNQYARVGY